MSRLPVGIGCTQVYLISDLFTSVTSGAGWGVRERGREREGQKAKRDRGERGKEREGRRGVRRRRGGGTLDEPLATLLLPLGLSLLICTMIT